MIWVKRARVTFPSRASSAWLETWKGNRGQAMFLGLRGTQVNNTGNEPPIEFPGLHLAQLVTKE